MVLVEYIYIDDSALFYDDRYVFSFIVECRLCNKVATTNLSVVV